MNARVTGGENPSAGMGRSAAPVGHDAASRLDHALRPLNVVGLKSRLDDEIHLTEGDEGVGVAVEPVACEQGARPDRIKPGTLCGGADFGVRGVEDRIT